MIRVKLHVLRKRALIFLLGVFLILFFILLDLIEQGLDLRAFQFQVDGVRRCVILVERIAYCHFIPFRYEHFQNRAVLYIRHILPAVRRCRADHLDIVAHPPDTPVGNGYNRHLLAGKQLQHGKQNAARRQQSA